MEQSQPLSEKELFIRNELLGSTIAAAFRRAKIFKKEVNKQEQAKLEKRKSEFRGHIREYLVEIGESYVPKNHLETIDGLKKRIEKKNLDLHVLEKNEISFGIAQKLVNLYLKYLWCLGMIDGPRDCPIDRLVLDESSQKHLHPWTLMNRDGYLEAMHKIKQIAGDSKTSIAMWELVKFNSGNRTYTRPRNLK